MVSPDIAEAALVAVVGIILFEGLFLAYVTYRIYRGAQLEQEAKAARAKAEAEAERSTLIEDVFLLHRSGLLLKHYTRRLRPNVDSDVLSGMLVAVQDFIKDSFRGERGHLNEIRFGEIRIVVLEGKWTILAAVVRGTSPYNIQPEMVTALAELESKYEDPLADWDGTMEQMTDVEKIMSGLVEGRYHGPPSITVKPAIVVTR
ncbi:MAG: hypothetical protein AABX36_04215 [Candidatus Thermoplasmatota archaeon]|jgi:hypothetical protein